MDGAEVLVYKLVGERLKNRRVELGLTQADVADSTDIDRSSLTNIEAARQKAPLHVLFKLCKFLQIELRDVIPTMGEMTALSSVSVEFEGQTTTVSPKAAEFLRSVQEDQK